MGIDVKMAFAAGANGLTVGLGAPTHVKNPVFDPELPGPWLVDLSHVDLSRVKVAKDKWAQLDAGLLPSPFTPKDERPEGPAWYATPTLAYAVEPGYDVAPVEAYVRHDNGRYLDAWYNRLRDAHLATMAPTSACTRTCRRPTSSRRWTATGSVLSAGDRGVRDQGDSEGGIGKLRERPRGEGWKPGQPWRALARPTWRPDVRAAWVACFAGAASAGLFPPCVAAPNQRRGVRG